MKKFITCGQMKILEKRANESGLSYYQMMENAGTAAAEVIISRANCPAEGMKVLLFCGKGNNGGDGFVVARKLAAQGAAVTLFLVDGPPGAGDAAANYKLIKNQVSLIDMSRTDSPFMKLDGRQKIIVDAIYGTGFHGSLSGCALRAAAFINQFQDKSLIVSLDIPSGLSGDATRESQIDPNAVRACCTVTFHNKKPVHLQSFSKKYCGETIIADIGIDEDLLW